MWKVRGRKLRCAVELHSRNTPRELNLAEVCDCFASRERCMDGDCWCRAAARAWIVHADVGDSELGQPRVAISRGHVGALSGHHPGIGDS